MEIQINREFSVFINEFLDHITMYICRCYNGECEITNAVPRVNELIKNKIEKYKTKSTEQCNYIIPQSQTAINFTDLKKFKIEDNNKLIGIRCNNIEICIVIYFLINQMSKYKLINVSGDKYYILNSHSELTWNNIKNININLLTDFVKDESNIELLKTIVYELCDIKFKDYIYLDNEPFKLKLQEDSFKNQQYIF